MSSEGAPGRRTADQLAAAEAPGVLPPYATLVPFLDRYREPLTAAGWRADRAVNTVPPDEAFPPGVSRLLRRGDRTIEVEYVEWGMVAVWLDAEAETPEDGEPPFAPGTYDLDADGLARFYRSQGLL